MVGANYMGGKRNAVRVKSKDIVGRAQRRHFGNQRLASALCVAQGKRVHMNTETLSSLPEITLAHARRDVTDSGATSSRRVSKDGLNLSRSLSNTTQRKQPSRILGALDTSDQDLSMRAAIDRILQQSNLVGINTETLGEIAPVESMQSPATVARSTQTSLTSKDSDAVYSETTSKHGIDTPATSSEIAEYGRTAFHEPDKNTRYWSLEGGILSQPDSPSTIRDMPSQRGMDDSRYTETQIVHTLFRTEGNRPDGLLDSVYPLPRSSPFASSSQSSNNSLLDLDTSPLAGIPFGRRPNDQSEDDCMDTRNFHPIPRLCPSSQSFSIRDGSVDEARSTILSFTNSDEEEPEAEPSRATCYDNNLTFSSAANNEFRDPFPSECRHDTFQIVMGSKVTEDVPNGISIDFLSDPHPWETIGRILELEPPAAQFSTLNFTNNREGVGYVSRERPDACNARLPDATFFETGIEESEDDTCVVSTTSLPVLPNADLEVGNTDDCMAVDTAKSPCVDSSIVPLLDQESPTIASNPFVDVNTLHRTPSISVVHCTKKEDTRSAFPPTTAVEATAPEPDMIFAGPCLFGDSDLEEDA